jgi:hypothetical protein
MDDFLERSQLADLEEYFPILTNLEGQEFSYMGLGKTV